jgi:hypothetical protein
MSDKPPPVNIFRVGVSRTYKFDLGHFGGSELKILRAKKHLLELEQTIQAYVADPASTDKQNWDSNTSAAQLRAAMGAMVGDVIHNLRAALDLMACDLVRLSGGNPKGVYFPFSKTADGLNKKIKDRDFNRAGSDAVALLKTYEPYEGGNSSLYDIHSLDITDKHQMLILSHDLVSWTVEGSGEVQTVSTPETITHTATGVVTLADPPPHAAIQIAFPEGGPFAGKEVITTLQGLVESVTTVVKAFALLREDDPR